MPRLILRAVRDSVIEFRGMNSEQRGVRLANWEEMLLNEYVYLSGDVIKLFQQRRGPRCRCPVLSRKRQSPCFF